jgi:hypothetical protein
MGLSFFSGLMSSSGPSGFCHLVEVGTVHMPSQLSDRAGVTDVGRVFRVGVSWNEFRSSRRGFLPWLNLTVINHEVESLGFKGLARGILGLRWWDHVLRFLAHGQ